MNDFEIGSVMLAEKLNIGDTIGLISPSHVADRETYASIIANLEHLGFKVKTGTNLYKDTWGNVASDIERADDLNSMVADPDVKLIFFGGGNGASDIISLIDYESIKKTPKLFLSYSDGTTILNAIYTQTGLVTYYGQTPGNYCPPDSYTYSNFESHIVLRDATEHIANSKWYTLNGGNCEGTLIGGYLPHFIEEIDSAHFMYETEKKYILFLEDCEKFNDVSNIKLYLERMEQTHFMKNVTGIILGHYSNTIFDSLFEFLKQFGKRNAIPVVYCDDFGHGNNHAIIPIGIKAEFDADKKTLFYSK